jgi:hypothetical protein
MISHSEHNRSYGSERRDRHRERLVWLAGAALVVLFLSSVALLSALLLHQSASANLVETVKQRTGGPQWQI